MATASQQSVHPQQEYIPGVCNIGPAERAKRRQSGIIASIVTLILLAILLFVNISPYWRLFLILPASAAATGFLQDAFHFCAGFGMRGVYNVLHSAGVTDNVELEEFRRKDRNKALLIVWLSLAIGLVFAVLTLFI